MHVLEEEIRIACLLILLSACVWRKTIIVEVYFEDVVKVLNFTVWQRKKYT